MLNYNIALYFIGLRYSDCNKIQNVSILAPEILSDDNFNKMKLFFLMIYTLHWRHNGRNGVSNHQPYDCLLNRLFRRRSKETPKLRVTGLCEGNSPGPDRWIPRTNGQ